MGGNVLTMTKLEVDIITDIHAWAKLYEETNGVPLSHFTSITGAVSEFNRVMRYTNINLRREVRALARARRRIHGYGPSGPIPAKPCQKRRYR